MGSRRRRRQPPPGRRTGSLLDRFSATSILLAGLVLGLAGGLYYAWIVAPVVFVDASPARFSEKHKAEYIYLVSQSYAADGNWTRAERRLAALDDPAMAQTVGDLLEAYLRQQRPAADVRNLAELAQALGAEGAVVSLFAPTPLAAGTATATPTATPLIVPTLAPEPTMTQTPRPTLTPTAPPLPTATSRLIYRLLAQQRVCRPVAAAPVILVETQDALLNPLPGVEVLISWDGGSDHFITGFKPSLGPGYGDFTMQPDISYTVVVADGSPTVSGLRIEPCDSGQAGGWELIFQNVTALPTATPRP